MLTDAGSIPAVSTNSIVGLDQSRPTIPSLKQPLRQTTYSYQSVSDGLEKSSFGHDSGTTFQSGLERALSLTQDIGTPHCHFFRKKIFDNHPPLCIALSHNYLRIAKKQNYREANLSLLHLDRRLQIKELNLSCSDEDIEEFCSRHAKRCEVFILEYPYSEEDQYTHICNHLKQYGIKAPKPDNHNPLKSCLKRTASKYWWLRQVRKLRMRAIESVARDMGFVCKKKSTYCSKWGVSLHREQVNRNKRLLESMVAVNDQGDTYSLKELAALSVSNPEIRRAELMTRIKGFEMVAEQYGHKGGFYTITTPSKMHACNTAGIQNPKYDGTTPREANDYLAKVWSLIRSSLARNNIKIYGFRVVEPHHDGTPHWHMLLFYREEDTTTIKETFKRYALLEDGEEPGAEKHRLKVEDIDSEKGGATNYIAKYISKNIDGEGLEEDLYGNEAKEAARAITAWASIWGIRQFQQIGGPSVTVWRELRRMECEDEGILESARKAADSGDWAAFVMAMGGPTLPSKDRPIKTALWIEENEAVLNVDTGELVQAYNTKYGNKPKGKVFGLVYQGKHILTRFYQWTVERLEPDKESAQTKRLISNRYDSTAQPEGNTCLGFGATLDLCQ